MVMMKPGQVVGAIRLMEIIQRTFRMMRLHTTMMNLRMSLKMLPELSHMVKNLNLIQLTMPKLRVQPMSHMVKIRNLIQLTMPKVRVQPMTTVP